MALPPQHTEAYHRHLDFVLLKGNMLEIFYDPIEETPARIEVLHGNGDPRFSTNQGSSRSVYLLEVTDDGFA